ncbi:MAG TPA: hypothetical protein VIW64_05680 [Pyrinomonadaceae bacterium]|jgi:hypothetical protein
MPDDQKPLFEILFASILNVIFLALIALLLWPLGKSTLALSLAKGYGVLWIVLYLTFLLLTRIHDLFRVNIYDRHRAFVFSNLVVSCALQVGWSAFAALAVHDFVSGSREWNLAVLYAVGLLSCLISFFVVSSFFQGHVYKLVSLPLATIGFVGFSAWLAFDGAIALTV